MKNKVTSIQNNTNQLNNNVYSTKSTRKFSNNDKTNDKYSEYSCRQKDIPTNPQTISRQQISNNINGKGNCDTIKRSLNYDYNTIQSTNSNVNVNLNYGISKNSKNFNADSQYTYDDQIDKTCNYKNNNKLTNSNINNIKDDDLSLRSYEAPLKQIDKYLLSDKEKFYFDYSRALQDKSEDNKINKYISYKNETTTNLDYNNNNYNYNDNKILENSNNNTNNTDVFKNFPNKINRNYDYDIYNSTNKQSRNNFDNKQNLDNSSTQCPYKSLKSNINDNLIESNSNIFKNNYKNKGEMYIDDSTESNNQSKVDVNNNNTKINVHRKQIIKVPSLKQHKNIFQVKEPKSTSVKELKPKILKNESTSKLNVYNKNKSRNDNKNNTVNSYLSEFSHKINPNAKCEFNPYSTYSENNNLVKANASKMLFKKNTLSCYIPQDQTILNNNNDNPSHNYSTNDNNYYTNDNNNNLDKINYNNKSNKNTNTKAKVIVVPNKIDLKSFNKFNNTVNNDYNKESRSNSPELSDTEFIEEVRKMLGNNSNKQNLKDINKLMSKNKIKEEFIIKTTNLCKSVTMNKDCSVNTIHLWRWLKHVTKEYLDYNELKLQVKSQFSINEGEIKSAISSCIDKTFFNKAKLQKVKKILSTTPKSNN